MVDALDERYYTPRVYIHTIVPLSFLQADVRSNGGYKVNVKFKRLQVRWLVTPTWTRLRRRRLAAFATQSKLPQLPSSLARSSHVPDLNHHLIFNPNIPSQHAYNVPLAKHCASLDHRLIQASNRPLQSPNCAFDRLQLVSDGGACSDHRKQNGSRCLGVS